MMPGVHRAVHNGLAARAGVSLVTPAGWDRTSAGAPARRGGQIRRACNRIKRTPFHCLPQLYDEKHETLPPRLEARRTWPSFFPCLRAAVLAPRAHLELIFLQISARRCSSAPCALAALPTTEFSYLINFLCMVVSLWTVGSSVFTDLFLLRKSSGGCAESAGHSEE